jgi:chemotaxis protein MotB
MAGDGKSLQPIIIKRIKKIGHAAHGGAWKIAYADFVTAMMAFFLLMWLLGSTATGDLQGIASYFNQPLKVSLMGGSGSGDSTSIVPGGGADIRRANGQVNKTDGAKSRQQMRAELKAARAELAKADAARLRELQSKINDVITANPRLAEYRSQIRIDLTPEGLRIQIVDEQNRPMFDVGSALVKPYMRDILREIGAALVGVENRISLAGHTDNSAYGNGERGYSNWELSSDRANASRRELVAGGMPDSKVFRVLGLASSDLFDPANPLNPVNRRISIIVMSQEAEERLRTGIDARLREAEAEAAEATAASSPAVPGR